jgi:hypothetical protein
VPEFDIEVSAQGRGLDELCSMYWATDDDGSFTYTVKSLAEQYGQPAHKVTRIVSEVCVARSLAQKCVSCGVGFAYKTRSEWTSRNPRYAPDRCSECVAEAKRQAAVARDLANAGKRAEIKARYRVVDNGEPIIADDLDLSEAMALSALFEDAEEVAAGITTPILSRTDHLTPWRDYDFKIVSALIDAGRIRVSPESPIEAFVWNEDGSLGDEFYPTLACYYMAGEGALGDRVQIFRESLSGLIAQENWPDHWVDEFPDFWFDLAVAECKGYLVAMLELHGLEFKPGQKTDDVLRRALNWYSIGQVFYFIWRAATNSAAYLARDKVPAKQAANSAITRISADVDRAYAQKWDIGTYQRDGRFPVSTLSHLVFTRALAVDDPMAYSPLSLPARRAGLELDWSSIDAGGFERLIFELVAETSGYENVAWLMHTNAADHGRDVSATRLRRDPVTR